MFGWDVGSQFGILTESLENFLVRVAELKRGMEGKDPAKIQVQPLMSRVNPQTRQLWRQDSALFLRCKRSKEPSSTQANHKLYVSEVGQCAYLL